ncbi:unnamed protein product [Discosporangium mesarthrocarpum]
MKMLLLTCTALWATVVTVLLRPVGSAPWAQAIGVEKRGTSSVEKNIVGWAESCREGREGRWRGRGRGRCLGSRRGGHIGLASRGVASIPLDDWWEEEELKGPAADMWIEEGEEEHEPHPLRMQEWRLEMRTHPMMKMKTQQVTFHRNGSVYTEHGDKGSWWFDIGGLFWVRFSSRVDQNPSVIPLSNQLKTFFLCQHGHNV